MGEPRVVRTYYRALYNGGKVWCESRRPDEVIRMSAGGTSKGEIEKYEKLTVVESDNGWEPWDALKNQ